VFVLLSARVSRLTRTGGFDMNIEAILLTALIALVVFGAAIGLATKMTWAIRWESAVFRAIARRNDARTYRDGE
jgi:hypothetical protein